MKRILVVGAALSILAPAGAYAHDPFGRAQPRLDLRVVRSGPARALRLHIVDVDSGNPIPNARVAVSARRLGSDQILKLSVLRKSNVLFSVQLPSPQGRTWRVTVRVFGVEVVPTSTAVDVQ